MPPFQGILMFRRALLQGMPLRSEGRGWGILMEFLLRATRRGATYVNRTTTLRPRSVGRSKVNNLRTIAANLRQLLVLVPWIADELPAEVIDRLLTEAGLPMRLIWLTTRRRYARRDRAAFRYVETAGAA